MVEGAQLSDDAATQGIMKITVLSASDLTDRSFGSLKAYCKIFLGSLEHSTEVCNAEHPSWEGEVWLPATCQCCLPLTSWAALFTSTFAGVYISSR